MPENKNIGTTIMDLLVFLLSDQEGRQYEYKEIKGNEPEDKTA